MFFGENRKAFLEFLRNLTPQALFLTLAFIFGSPLDLSLERDSFDFTYEGVRRTIPYLFSLLVFIGACLANITLFIESALVSPARLKKLTDRITRLHPGFFRRIKLNARATWRHNKSGYLEVFLVLLISQTAFIAVVVVAARAALDSTG
ncbi:hypothetical protein BZK31_16725 [Pseudomonas floridensis]|uniref:Uncharacterized protein n=1 Tax=Pseudomonas floridensis TaxID=1958950 RepID=A0A1X0N589_9PSED|nr:hypothetical protein [Pseudomonas floridensis]ORC58077.1 hypothetical protein BZK31_16725 [Pseudomonas floridensis]